MLDLAAIFEDSASLAVAGSDAAFVAAVTSVARVGLVAVAAVNDDAFPQFF